MIEFREATPHDAPSIAKLHAESWRSAYRGMLRDEFLDNDIYANRLALWEQRLSMPAVFQYALLATENNQLLGFACVFGRADPQWGAMLDNLHITPMMKGKGIGKRLLHRASNWVWNRLPSEGLFLWVYEANAPARRFYERLGAQIHERVVVETPGGGSVPEVRYAWPNVQNLRSATQN